MSDLVADPEIADAQAKQVATAQFAVDRQVEQGEVSFVISDLEADPYRL